MDLCTQVDDTEEAIPSCNPAKKKTRCRCRECAKEWDSYSHFCEDLPIKTLRVLHLKHRTWSLSVMERMTPCCLTPLGSPFSSPVSSLRLSVIWAWNGQPWSSHEKVDGWCLSAHWLPAGFPSETVPFFPEFHEEITQAWSPVSSLGLFGDALGAFSEKFKEAQKQSKIMTHFLLKQAHCPPQAQSRSS